MKKVRNLGFKGVSKNDKIYIIDLDNNLLYNFSYLNPHTIQLLEEHGFNKGNICDLQFEENAGYPEDDDSNNLIISFFSGVSDIKMERNTFNISPLAPLNGYVAVEESFRYSGYDDEMENYRTIYIFDEEYNLTNTFE